LVALYARLIVCKLTKELIVTGFLPAVTTCVMYRILTKFIWMNKEDDDVVGMCLL
jgi:hypothetical protein